jgi:hypothetical protein
MGIWKKLKEKFGTSVADDSEDAQFSDQPPTEEKPTELDERLTWIKDNFSGWPSASYSYVALIETRDPVVGVKRSLKFYKRPTVDGVASYSREYIDNLLNNGE